MISCNRRGGFGRLFPRVAIFPLLFLWASWSHAEPLGSLTVDSNGYTLSEDLTVTGDVTVSGGILDINGHTLTINGSLNITGNNSRLKMMDAADVVAVDANVTFNGAASDGYLTAGILRIGGNFDQIGIYNNTNRSENENADYSNNIYSFYASGTHKVVFDGTVAQTVRLTDLPWRLCNRIFRIWKSIT